MIQSTNVSKHDLVLGVHDELFQDWKDIFVKVAIYRKLKNFHVIYGSDWINKNSISPSCKILDITTFLPNKTGGLDQIRFMVKATKSYSFELFVLDKSTALKKRRLLSNTLSYTGPNIGTSRLSQKQKKTFALRLQQKKMSEARVKCKMFIYILLKYNVLC